MRRFLAVTLALLLTAAAEPAIRVDAPAGAAADDYVRLYSLRSGAQPTARWLEPVCPKVDGMAERYATMVSRRIREVAAETGVPVAAEGCKPNVIVTFTDNSARLLAAIAKADPRAFAETPEPQRKLLLTGGQPVSWWYRTAALDSDGRPLRSESTNLFNTPGVQLGDDVTTTSAFGSSLIKGRVQRGLRGVAVIVDLSTLSGRPLRAVSSFVALVALAEVQPGHGDAAAPSILAAWSDTGQKINDLTPLDRAYLSALYRVPADRPGQQQRGMIVAAMKVRAAS